MDTKALRQKILDLAIHGKLVSQDPNDEPASVLLERIRAEKERLIKEGKIKKGKKSAKTSDKPHYPYELPKGWVWTTLGDLFSLQAGKNIAAKEIYPEFSEIYKYPCFGGNGIRGFVSNFNRNGDFPIIGRQGALCGNVNLAIGDFYATEHAVVVERFSDTDLMWTYYVLIALNLNQYATATAQPGLAVNVINDVIVPVPPFQEQCRISKAVTRLFSLINEIEHGKQKLQGTIKQTKSKVLDLAVHGKLVPQDVNDEPANELLKRINPKAEIITDNGHYQKVVPFKLPNGWSWTTLGSITNYGSCTTSDVLQIPDSAWVLELEDIEKDSAKILSIHTKKDREIKGVRRSFKKGEILYSKLRTYLNKVLVASQDGFCTTEIIPISVSSVIDNIFLCHVLRSQYFLDYTSVCGYGVKMPRLSTKDAQNGLVPLPPRKEQLRIISKIEELFHQLDIIEESL